MIGKGKEQRCMCVCMLCRVQLFVISWTVTRQAPLSMGFSRHEYCAICLQIIKINEKKKKNTGQNCYGLLQRIFLNQGWNLHLLHWWVYSLPLGHLGSPGEKDEDEKQKRKTSFPTPSCQVLLSSLQRKILKLINLTVPDLLWSNL